VRRADLVVLRATWDYVERRDEFLAWCDSVPALANPARAVRWSTDKSYLVDLASDGVPVVPTALVPPGETASWPSGPFVVKPAVGAGSRDAARFAAGEHDAAAAHLSGLHERGFTALVQPYQERVDADGETALVFLGGVHSHAFTKGAMLVPDARRDASGLYVLERLSAAAPDAGRRRLAEDALDSAVNRLGLTRADLLYARVDVVTGDDGRPLVLELELAEPSLGFRQTGPDAAGRFASAVRAALSR
jgi:glutathione synthase/RimK-type ligase-like ATP-grasp enzyme